MNLAEKLSRGILAGIAATVTSATPLHADVLLKARVEKTLEIVKGEPLSVAYGITPTLFSTEGYLSVVLKQKDAGQKIYRFTSCGPCVVNAAALIQAEIADGDEKGDITLVGRRDELNPFGRLQLTSVNVDGKEYTF